MKVISARVNWMRGWANEPYLEILIDRIPNLNELVFEHRDWAYFAEKEGYVHFFSWSGKGNDDGYYGDTFPIKVREEGMVKEVTLLGPWSSRAGAMNLMGFTSCVDVSIIDDPEAFKRGYTFIAGAISLELAKEAVAMLPNVYLVKVVDSTDISYIPSVDPDRVVKLGKSS